MTITIADQIKCVKREIALRERVYPSFVARGKLKPHEAERQLEAMRAVLASLQEMVAEKAAEIISWRDPATKPDSDVTVLLHVPAATSEPVWPGYWDDERKEWLWAEGAPVPDPVKGWAELPKGAA